MLASSITSSSSSPSLPTQNGWKADVKKRGGPCSSEGVAGYETACRGSMYTHAWRAPSMRKGDMSLPQTLGLSVEGEALD